ncbi:hypothetical protein C8T65DRAFT_657441 [Cerioporus squamosus]|nr:hypothetical protein C8T65DRAFT_657441 [Cerioporus squamosus]
MADPFCSFNMPSSSNNHKRTYDDITPELDAGRSAPSGSRGEPDPSDDTDTSRERSKRPRNDNSDSSYVSEVDDVLLPSNTSVSSSSSGSSLSSYHSARSTLTAASPPLLEVEEELEDDSTDPVADSSQSFPPVSSFPTLDVSMEDSMAFVSRPLRISPPPPVPSAAVPDSEEQFRRTMERVDEFDRQMSALRQSPFRPANTTDWALWNGLSCYLYSRSRL